MRLYALRACDEGVLLYPVYALLFADTGLSGGQISSLFVIWSITTFTLEVPSGAWADAYSRRRMLALAGVLRAAAFLLWVAWPSYPAFAAGFLLWGISGALQSGTTEALVFDELAAVHATDRYVSTMGRSETVGLLSMLAATALAAPTLAIGGYPLLGVASVAVSLAGAAVALGFPETPRVRPIDGDGGGAGEGDGGGGVRHYLAMLRAGLAEVRGDRRVSRAVVLAAAVPGITAIDEYVPLLARAMGAGTVAVPLLVLLPVVAMAAVSALAGRGANASPVRMGAALAVGAVMLAAGALAPHPAGMLAIAGAFGVLQFGMVLTDARLQETITGPARATVLSVAGFGAEVVAVLVFAAVGLGSAALSIPVLIALCALPLAGTAMLTAAWLPPVRRR